jgi:hypothetical protein
MMALVTGAGRGIGATIVATGGAGAACRNLVSWRGIFVPIVRELNSSRF